MIKLWKCFMTLAGIMLLANASNASLEYRIRDLGTIHNGDTYAYGINNSGLVVGHGYFHNGAVWQLDGSKTDIPQLPGAFYSSAYSINDSGTVVCESAMLQSGRGQAYIWSSSSGVHPIAPLEGYSYNSAFGINNSGLVVGASANGGASTAAAFKWSLADGLTRLSTLASFTGAGANNVNDLGEVVGKFSRSDASHACMWDANGNPVDLGVLCGASGEAYAINNAGQVVGGSSYSTMDWRHAFIWTKDSGMRDIDNLSSQSSEAFDINANGLAVGRVTVTDGSQAFVWSEETGMVVLDGLPGSRYYQAYAVNDSGVIVGMSINASGKEHAVLWEPVPEPSSIIVLLAGVGTLIRFSRRRQ